MLIHSAERGLENLFVTMLVLSEFAWYTCIRNKHSLILFLCTQKREQLLEKGVEKNIAAGWSITRQCRRLRQIIVFQDTNNIPLFYNNLFHFTVSWVSWSMAKVDIHGFLLPPWVAVFINFPSFQTLSKYIPELSLPSLYSLFSLFFSALLIRLTQILDDSLEALVNEL